MSRSIDERVVEMRFDNDQFERGASESIETLERLKGQIDKSTSGESFEGLEQAANSVDFGGISENVEALARRFSALGIVGMRVLENITDSVMSVGGRLASFVTDTIVSGGVRRAMNIENAHFQLQALLNDEDRVQEVMDNAMQSVDGTAYAYDEAAKAASILTASGVEAGDEMMRVLNSITGVAATVSADYQDIADIFTTVAGQGSAMADQFNRLTYRGMNGFAVIRDYVQGVRDGLIDVGDIAPEILEQIDTLYETTINKYGSWDEGSIRQIASDRLVTADIFFTAMSEKFAEAAGRANETFTGAFSNIKAALARIGADFISPIIAQNSKVVELFNTIRVNINTARSWINGTNDALDHTVGLSERFTTFVLGAAEALNNFINSSFFRVLSTASWMGFYNILDGISNILKLIWQYMQPIGQAFREVFFGDTSIVSVARGINDVTGSFRDFTASLTVNETALSTIHDIFSGIFSVVKAGIGIVKTIIQIISPIFKPLAALGGLFATIAGAIGNLITHIVNFASESVVLQQIAGIIRQAFDAAMSAIAWVINGFSKLINRIKESESGQRILQALHDAFVAIGERVSPILERASEHLGNFIDRVAEIVPERAQQAVDWLAEKLEHLVDALLGVEESEAGDELSEVEEHAEGISGILGGISTVIETIKTFIHDIVAAIRGELNPESEEFANTLEDTNSVVGRIIGGAGLAGALLLIINMVRKAKALHDTFGRISGILSGRQSIFGEGQDPLSGITRFFYTGAESNYTRTVQRKVRTLAMIIAAIAGLIASIALLAQQDLKGILAATIATGAIIAEVIALVVIINNTTWKDPAPYLKTASQMVLSFAVLVAAMALLAKNDWESILAAGVSLSLVIGVLGLVFVALDKTDVKTSSIIKFEFLASTLVAIGIALSLVAMHPWESILAAGTAISEVLIVLSVCFAIIETVGKASSIASALIILELIGVLAAVAIAIGVLAQNPWENLLAAGTAIAEVLLSLSVIMGVSVIVGAAAPLAIAGLGVILLFIGAFIGVLVAMGAIFEHPTARRFLEGGLDVINTIFTGIGTAIGNAVGAFGEAASSHLPEIGSNISAFAENLQPFLDIMGNMDSGLGDNITQFAQGMLAITTAGFLDGIREFLGFDSPFERFGTQLVAFVGPISEFNDAISDIDINLDKIGEFAEAVKCLAQMAAAVEPYGPSLRTFVFGSNNLTGFGEHLVSYASSFSNLVDTIDPIDIDVDKLVKFIAVTQKLVEMANDIDASGGFLTMISSGDDTLTGFGNHLASFGPQFARFIDSIDDVNVDSADIDGIIDVINAFSELETPTQSSFFQKLFTGDDSLSGFSSGLSSLGGAIASLYNSIRDVDPGALENLVSVIDHLANIETGDTGFIAIIDGLNLAAEHGISDFIGQFNSSSVLSDLESAIATFIDCAKNKIGEQDAEFQNAGKLSAKAYVTGFANYSSKATEAGRVLVDQVISSLIDNLNELYDAGNKTTDHYIQGIRSSSQEVNNSGRELAKHLAEGVMSSVILQIIKTAGSESANNYASGVLTQSEKANQAGKLLGSLVYAGVSAYNNMIAQVGVQAGQGYVNGINTQAAAAYQAGYSLGNASVRGGRNALNEKSPSKVMYEVGSYGGEGFVNGLIAWMKPAENVSGKLGQKTVKTLGESIRNAIDVVNADMERFNPVITPLIDTTSAEASANLIASMFSNAVSSNTIGAEITNGTMRSIIGKSDNSLVESSTGTTNNFQFIQNNTSPKALDRIEIYRQTRNQISLMKEVVNTV